MKQESRRIAQKADCVKVERLAPPASPRRLAGKALWIATIASSLLIVSSAGAQNLGSPAFANPPEVRSNQQTKTLRMIMELKDGTFLIPNVGQQTLRQFRGWDAAGHQAALGTSVSPGPTLRARLGDRVQVSFFNKIDDSKFPYTFVTAKDGNGTDIGCDKVPGSARQGGVILPYPGKDAYPNCFHGSSTANIHFHGTHTSPNGLGDNVLVQVLPQAKQPDWTSTFRHIFNGPIPQKWMDLPADYRNKQMELITKHDTAAAEAALKNGLPPPEPLAPANQNRINAGLWPQYIMGAFPNYFDVPDFNSGKWAAGQAPGTHWYHAHKHGSTSLHMRNGLAGALIIESTQSDGYDQVIRAFYHWGNSYGEHERILVFQQFDPTQNLERSPRGAAGGPPVNAGKGSAQTLVNGKLTPTITMKPGEVQLWRFINATEGNLFGNGIIDSTLFATAGFAFKQTAMDGVQFSPANYAAQPFLSNVVPGGLTLAAGSRADVLVQAPQTPGVTAFKITNPAGNPTIFFVEVTKSPSVHSPNWFPTTWPKMPPFLNDLPKPGPNDVKNPDSPVKFQWDKDRAGPGLVPKTAQGFPPHYMINDKQFEEHGPHVDQCMPLNGLQDWVLENFTSTIAHPFHIHINPFQVIKIEKPELIDSKKPVSASNVKYTNYAPTSNWVWQDVIAIPPAQITPDGKQIFPGRVTIRQTYKDFTGDYVLHCHILAHEDRGMMQLVRVLPANQYNPVNCQAFIPAHH